ncbi:MAG TPA: hypothetical protein VLC91_00475 [Spongiibacteraceae bacterium]|nr:hypothetical protein [Spongiibacteraceae bacterium]
MQDCFSRRFYKENKMLFGRFARSVVLAPMILLVACGGGGGGGGSAAAPTTFPIAAAMRAKLTNGMQVPIVLDGRVFNLKVQGESTLFFGRAGAATFNGQAGMSSETNLSVNVTIESYGSSLGLYSDTAYYDSNYNLLGSLSQSTIDGNGPSNSVVTAYHPLPESARVNDSGAFYEAITYAMQSQTTVKHNDVATYLVKADSANSVLLELTTKFYGLDDSLMETRIESYRVTGSGAISFVSLQISEISGNFTNISAK